MRSDHAACRTTQQGLIVLRAAGRVDAGSQLTTRADLVSTGVVRVVSLVILVSAQSALDGQYAIGGGNAFRSDASCDDAAGGKAACTRRGMTTPAAPRSDQLQSSSN